MRCTLYIHWLLQTKSGRKSEKIHIIYASRVYLFVFFFFYWTLNFSFFISMAFWRWSNNSKYILANGGQDVWLFKGFQWNKKKIIWHFRLFDVLSNSLQQQPTTNNNNNSNKINAFHCCTCFNIHEIKFEIQMRWIAPPTVEW